MTEAQKPNLLYIHSDQHSPKVLGCYGDPLVQTPHLDHLAERGTVFENAYCPSPVCTPSRMSMLTGRYPFENEAWVNHHVLDSGIPTMAHAMGAAGALELAGNLPAFDDGIVHPTINVDELDEQCELPNLVLNEALSVDRVDTVLNNSFGMLGINSCVIIKRFTD